MKNILKLLSLTFVLAFASCSVDQVNPKYIDGTSGVTFDNAKYTTEITNAETGIEVRVSRVSATQPATIGLMHNCTNLDIFNIPNTVTFAQGEYEKYILIPVETDSLKVGTTYSFQLTLGDVASPSGTNTTNISVKLKLVWVAAGEAVLTSQWEGVTDTVPVQHAVGTNMYRLESPYYYLTPQWVPDPGYHITFTVDENFNAVSFDFADIGEDDADGNNIYILDSETCKLYNGPNVFINVGNVYTIYAVFAFGPNENNLTPGWRVTEQFVWTR